MLASGEVRVAFPLRSLTETVCCPRSAVPPAGRLAGQEAWALAQEALAPVPCGGRAVRVTVFNALSAHAMAWSGDFGGRRPGVDALEGAEFGGTAPRSGAYLPV